MSFHWPHLFWLLLVPAALALLEARTGRRRATATAHPKIGRAEAGLHDLEITSAAAAAPQRRQIRWRLHLGLAFVIASLARPQWGKMEEPVFDQAREIIIALDLSRSMLATDVKPSRLERARLLVTSLLERLAGERVGLVVFAGTAFLQSPLSSDYEILNEFLPNLTPEYLPQGGSNYRALIDEALAAFGASGSADRFLIILSDGEATEDSWKTTAQELKAKAIRVIALGIGTPAGSIIPDPKDGYVKDERGAVVLSKLQPATLQELSTLTGGVYVDASSWVDLAQLLQSTVEAGRAGDYKEQRAARLMERFQWVLAPGLVLLFWSLCSEFPVHPRAREVKLRPQLRGQAKGAAAALLLGLVLIAPASEMRAEEPKGTSSAAEPLSRLVSDFSARPALGARDFAELARTTLTYAERTQASQQPVIEGAIRDGLSAVNAGEAADPKAADWSDLRQKLERFLEKPEPPPQQEPPPDQQKEQESKDQQQPKDNQQQSKEDSQQKEDQQKQDENSKQQEPKEDDAESKENQQKSGEPPPGKSGDPKEQKEKEQPPQSAFGNMQQPPTPPPTPSVRETQKVGGTPEQQKAPPPTDPALVVPLQKLEQVKNQDAPVRLQQLMRGEQEKPEQTGKNW